MPTHPSPPTSALNGLKVFVRVCVCVCAHVCDCVVDKILIVFGGKNQKSKILSWTFH